jgi:hypothetical protein
MNLVQIRSAAQPDALEVGVQVKHGGGVCLHPFHTGSPGRRR